jgi:hypothetical protein
MLLRLWKKGPVFLSGPWREVDGGDMKATAVIIRSGKDPAAVLPGLGP